jgi:internalin A
MTTSRFRIRTSPPENLTEAKLRIDECVQNRNEVLNLEDLNLTQLPEDVASLTWLTQLWLSRNYISEIPEFIGQLKKLKTLILQGNPLRQLPSTLSLLTDLRTLAIAGGTTSVASFSIGQLTN